MSVRSEWNGRRFGLVGATNDRKILEVLQSGLVLGSWRELPDDMHHDRSELRQPRHPTHALCRSMSGMISA